MTQPSTFPVGQVPVVDTFAEAFPMSACRLVLTAETERWVEVVTRVVTGYATSVIACDCEAGRERLLTPEETPDGRPGVSILLFGFSRDALEKATTNRVGQCVLTCPTTACFDGFPDADPQRRIKVGANLRYFGDGFQISKKLLDRRLWRIPVMDGEFLCEATVGTVKAIGGGNLIIEGDSTRTALRAAEVAVRAIDEIEGTVLPFPGGVVRSGSKVGSKYPKLRASTNDAFCPTLREQVTSVLHPDTRAVYEIVIDGVSETAISEAMRVGGRAALESPGVTTLTAGNYGGKLGPHHFHLREIFATET